MNTKTVRINDELNWVALRYRFYKVDMLKAAIEDGTLEAMLKDCADKLYAGDLTEVVKMMRRNLSSQHTNMKKAKYVAPEAKDDWARYELLWAYTGKLAEDSKPVVHNLPVSTKAKARWMLTVEEMDQIPADDFTTLDSIYQNMASKLAKKPADITAVMTMADWNTRWAHISELRSAARKAQKATESKVAVSDALLQKLQKGGKATLTAEEVAELQKIFNK